MRPPSTNHQMTPSKRGAGGAAPPSSGQLLMGSVPPNCIEAGLSMVSIVCTLTQRSAVIPNSTAALMGWMAGTTAAAATCTPLIQQERSTSVCACVTILHCDYLMSNAPQVLRRQTHTHTHTGKPIGTHACGVTVHHRGGTSRH